MTYRLVDLTSPWDTKLPRWPFVMPVPDPTYSRITTHSQGRKGGTTHSGGIYNGPLHLSTHMDAPAHCVDRGITIGNIPLEKCYGTGVIVDFRHMKKWHRITAEDFENATPEIQEGDIVICNTGWHKWWYVKDYIYFNHYPGLVPSGAEWLIKKKVKAIGGTWGANDHPLAHAPLQREMPWLYDEYMQETGTDPSEEFPIWEPVHGMLLKEEMPAIESVGGDIDQVTGMRCTIAAFPPRFMEGDGCFIRLVAIVDN